MPPTLYIALALIVVVVLRRFAPVPASIGGIGVALGVGAWGAYTYQRGIGMTFLGSALPPTVFFVAVAVLLGFEVLNLSLALKRKHREPPQAS